MKMGRVFGIVAACFVAAGCVSNHSLEPQRADFIREVSGAGRVHLVGWVRLSGEFEIYSDRAALKAFDRFPNCISAVFSDQYERKDRSTFDGKKAAVVGDLFDYEQLPEEDRPALPRRMLSDVIIPNACFGSKVLLLKTMVIKKAGAGQGSAE
jgi:hypothetical protein